MEGHNVQLVSDAIEALLNGSLDAFIWDSTRLDFESARNCRLRTRGSLFGRSAYGIGLQKNSPWTPHITAAILRLSESGMMEHLDAKWISARSEADCVVEAPKVPARLGLTNMKDVFILVTGGVLAGCVFSTIEVTYGRSRASRKRRADLTLRCARKWRSFHPTKPRAYRWDGRVLKRVHGTLEALTLQEWQSRKGLPETTIKQFRPEYRFARKPVLTFCSRCRRVVETELHRVSGSFAWGSAICLCLCLFWPCTPLPLFLSCCSDFVHVCPCCAHKIGQYRRARPSRFFV